MITQLGYIGIGVKDLGAWEDYTENVLGLSVAERLDDGTLYVRQDEYHHRFIVEPTGEDDLKYAGWLVATMDGMAEMERRLRAEGVTITEGTPDECEYRRVVHFIHFTDPNGLRSEIAYGLHVEPDRPFHSPRAITGFNAGNLGLGHILITVKDVEESERFYRDVLGMKVSDYIMMQRPDGGEVKLCFFHVNGRQHSLAFGALPSPKRLGHFMLETKTLTDTGLTWDLVRERGVPIQSSLGKHSNDHMTSFYMVSPSGFGVEYGWGGRLVDDSEWVVQRHHTANVWGHERAVAATR